MRFLAGPQVSKLADSELIVVVLCRNLKESLTAILLSGNDLEGNIEALAPTHLIRVALHDNPKLCGMVPASVRYAVGFDPTGTRLGEPC